MKLTKQEWCVAVMAGCLAGLAGSAVVLAEMWLAVNRPVDFWLAVVALGVGALSFFAMRWAREYRAWRRRPRPELWACARCGKLNTLDKHVSHRCGRDIVTVLKLKD